MSTNNHGIEVFVDRLKQLFHALGVKPSPAAKQMGLSTGFMSEIMRGKAGISGKLLLGIASKYPEASINWLLTGDGEMFGGMAEEDDDSETVWINRYDVEASAGHGSYAESEDVAGYMPFRKDWLRKRGLDPKNLAAIDVLGDSMESVFYEGDVVLVDLTQTKITSGKIYILRIGEELLVKYLQQLPGEQVRVFSENRAVYPPFEVNNEELESRGMVIGRVVASTREW